MIKRLIPHVTITLALALIIFMILDQYNPLMNFEFNKYSQNIINIFCIVALMNAFYTLTLLHKGRNK